MKKLTVFEKIILLLIIGITLFIWAQSVLPKTASSNESNWVAQNIVKPSVDAFSETEVNVHTIDTRKIAHLVEFSALGILLALFFGSIKKCHYALLFGFAVGFFDESIQIISNRAPEIKDVWIDTFGVAIGMVIGFAAIYFIRFVKSKTSR